MMFFIAQAFNSNAKLKPVPSEQQFNTWGRISCQESRGKYESIHFAQSFHNAIHYLAEGSRLACCGPHSCAGVAAGYLFRGSRLRTTSAGSFSQNSSAATSQSQASANAAVQPLLDRLRQDPTNSELLANIGNQYYDNHYWAKAVEYYRRSLQIEPGKVDVKTDMGTAIWYGGDAQGAIREYEAVLNSEPDYPQTLFNMGIVEWQGLHDNSAALKTWQTLLQKHPEYPNRKNVEELIEKVQFAKWSTSPSGSSFK